MRFEDVLLRNFTGGVFDAGCLDGLARDADVLIVNAQFVVDEEQVVKGLVGADANVEAHLFEIGFCDIHIRLRYAGAQVALPSAGERLADAEHILGGVVIPGLLEGNAPGAIHGHGIVESAGDGHMRLGHCDAARGDGDLRVFGEGDALNFFEGQRWGVGLAHVVVIEQGCCARKAVGAGCGLRRGNGRQC